VAWEAAVIGRAPSGAAASAGGAWIFRRNRVARILKQERDCDLSGKRVGFNCRFAPNMAVLDVLSLVRKRPFALAWRVAGEEQDLRMSREIRLMDLQRLRAPKARRSRSTGVATTAGVPASVATYEATIISGRWDARAPRRLPSLGSGNAGAGLARTKASI
jgi:hypothetical protein